MDAKRRAVAALSAANSPTGTEGTKAYVTNYVTNAAKKGSADSQVIEKNGGPGLTRTTDLTLISCQRAL
jgi:hypothetical protein